MTTDNFRIPATKEEKIPKLLQLGLSEDEARLITAPISSLINDKALLLKAVAAGDRRATLVRKANEAKRKAASKNKVFGAPAMHTYETQ